MSTGQCTVTWWQVRPPTLHLTWPQQSLQGLRQHLCVWQGIHVACSVLPVQPVPDYGALRTKSLYSINPPSMPRRALSGLQCASCHAPIGYSRATQQQMPMSLHQRQLSPSLMLRQRRPPCFWGTIHLDQMTVRCPLGRWWASCSAVSGTLWAPCQSRTSRRCKSRGPLRAQ